MTYPPQPNPPNPSFGQQPERNTPAQGFNPQQPQPQWGPQSQWDGNQGWYQNFPGGGPKPKNKTGLIVGLVALGVLLAGGIVALILVLTGHDENNAAPGSPSSSAQSSTQSKPPVSSSARPSATPTAPSTGSTASQGSKTPGSASELLIAYITAYNTPDQATSIALLCPDAKEVGGPDPGEKLQVTGQLMENGDTATVDATVTEGDQAIDLTMMFYKQTTGWCVGHPQRRN